MVAVEAKGLSQIWHSSPSLALLSPFLSLFWSFAMKFEFMDVPIIRSGESFLTIMAFFLKTRCHVYNILKTVLQNPPEGTEEVGPITG